MALPLPTLLSQVLIALTAELEVEGKPSLAVWSNILGYVGDGIEQRRLEEVSRLSKRLIRPALKRLEKAGYITTESKFVRLTDDAHWAPAFDDVERAWSQRFDMAALRTSLEDLVRQLPFELPCYPASYGTADLRVTGGPGEDWTFWPRTEPVEGLPLTALLSQALLAFAIDYEHIARVALAHTVNVLRLVTDEGTYERELPIKVGSLRWHPYVEVGPKKLVTLTQRGRYARDNYIATCQQVERDWDKRYGVATLRASLEPIASEVGGDLHHPPLSLD